MSKTKRVLETIAKREGLSVSALKKEMQAAIDEAYVTPNFNARCIPSKGDIPTVEEFLEYTVQRTRRRTK